MCSDETMRRLSAVEDELLKMLEIQTMRGLESVDAEELGEVVDMVKDIAEAKYYCSVVLAMEEEEEGPMGYNNRRYANGRYAPKGRGSMGYEPIGGMRMNEPWEGSMGYYGGSQGGGMQGSGYSSPNMQTGSQGGSGGSMGYSGNGYGEAYSRYQQAKMGYSMAKTAENRKGMDDAANEHVREFTDSMTDMWRDADQSQRNQMRNALVKFVNELK